MDQQEQLEKIESKLRITNQELESMDPLSKYEDEEEDMHWIIKKSERSNEELWNHFGGRKAEQYFIDLDQGEQEYRKNMKISFSDKYDEIEHNRNVLLREREELSEEHIKIKKDLEKPQKESE
ncbi:hypothetical protein [Anaerosacchariphilus polymeriproducens]|uniref:Uncharacterized protein n=1 Tax=Anaerosacchariphilus polymeriproducens TaxID=1812858 RepID=A0A371AZG5_9FIRM|nr:hypothetical protein [Anaerosacchariphilus polymeriproducens]RDU24939.1 hypothetical protein DWV06_01545 [Anaerosacchariphilus polymeriproducens]